MEKNDKIMTEEDIERELKEMVPEDILNDNEKYTVKQLAKITTWPHIVKYIKSAHPDLGLKEAKTYYDLYIKK